MSGRMIHRGPDDSGFWEGRAGDRSVGFGFRRLVVVDRSGGQQPMSDRNDDTVLVFNGEIYNHRELRSQLEQRGHRFRSDHSDTETLLHAYREWGEGVVDRLRGMFAFAIWDAVRERLILVTDPYGKKPLYYFPFDGGIVFASELSALLAHQSLDGNIDREALMRYFAFGYVPAPQSLVCGVSKLGAGRALTFSARIGEISVKRYYAYRVSRDKPQGTIRDWKVQLGELLDRAVSRRLEADVPLGFLLSGGLDSAMVLASAKRLQPDIDLSCYTVGFEEASYDESRAAAVTAAAVGARHQVDILPGDLSQSLVDEVLLKVDEPLADPSVLPTWLACRAAARELTVALSGDGADELFGGYDTFAALPIAEAYSRIVPRGAHSWVRALAARLPRGERN